MVAVAVLQSNMNGRWDSGEDVLVDVAGCWVHHEVDLLVHHALWAQRRSVGDMSMGESIDNECRSGQVSIR